MENAMDEEAAAAAASAIMRSLEEMEAVVFFEKPLTSSDASGSGRVVIPKAIAEQYFPKLDEQIGVLVDAVDTLGNQYNFRFRFWINNQSRMYLLEGAGELHDLYGLKMGDVMVFAQQKDGTLVVAGRPSTKADMMRRPPVKRPPAAQLPSLPKNKDSQRGKGGEKGPDGRPAPKRKKTAGAANDPDAPQADGIFRAVTNGLSDQPSSVQQAKNGKFMAVLNLAGELYQAFFECQEDAMEAFSAAGFSAVC